jgi:hypothetical protein
MRTRTLIQTAGLAGALLLAGCATTPYDYTNYREHPPRSILVLPPLNKSVRVGASYSYLSTATEPLAELGYYVFPVAVVDQFLKENGMPTPGEMHQVPLYKVAEIIGADAVMFITLEQYGSSYQVVSSATTVQIKARLVDTRTGLLLWEGMGMAMENSGGSGNIFADMVEALLTQAINSSTDEAHSLCYPASLNAFYPSQHGLLFGPYHPNYGADK